MFQSLGKHCTGDTGRLWPALSGWCQKARLQVAAWSLRALGELKPLGVLAGALSLETGARPVAHQPVTGLCFLRGSLGATALPSVTDFKAPPVLSGHFQPHLKGIGSLRKVVIPLLDPECRAPGHAEHLPSLAVLPSPAFSLFGALPAANTTAVSITPLCTFA